MQKIIATTVFIVLPGCFVRASVMYNKVQYPINREKDANKENILNVPGSIKSSDVIKTSVIMLK